MRAFLLLLMLMPFAAPGDTLPESPPVLLVHYPASGAVDDNRSAYFIALLHLAIDKTQADFGLARLVPVQGLETQSRALAQLTKDLDIDVLWTMTSIEREQKLLPVRVPLMKGLMGLRLLIVREQDLQRFAHIETLVQLRELSAGQGEDWPDSDIMRFNGLVVKTSVNYRALFKQLESRRFDYLPRAFNEPFDELANLPEMDLVVEPRLALLYPTASYFFVSRHNPALAKRLQTGLERAIADGSFDELFWNHPQNKEAFEKADIDERIILRLANPVLPDETPLSDKRLWYFKH